MAPPGSTPVWVGQAGDAIFVRSIRGRRGGWYRRLGANPDGEVGGRAHTHPVRARPVQDAGRRPTALTNGSGQNQDEQAQGDPSEAPVCSATGPHAGVRARNLATDSPPKRARSSLGWDHVAAAKVRHGEGCREARV